MALLVSGALFLIFAINVGLGAFAGASFLGDVGEMLVLFAASGCFVAAIIKKEAEHKADKAK